MKTPEQLKGTIRSMATKKNLRAQEVLQMFLFERILDRLANSDYQKNFILKGGLLISSMIGIGERTTMDMDTTVRGIQMEEDDKALGLIAGEDGEYGNPETLDADLILVDEVSMLDIYLAGDLFDSVKPGSQLILIGDADQLPSVGPGAVLSEMIASDTIPIVKLDKIFRQTAGSRIATNAKLIRHGNMSLEYGSDFQFYDSVSIPKSAEKIVELYLQETAKYGVDNVALLSPYRQKTETGVNALNELLREKINPPAPDKAEVVHGTRRFRCGDKVMQIKNCDEISNGDIGYITKICKAGDETTVTIDFGDGRTAEYDTSQLDMLDLGYASTIHKSQGSE